MRILLIVSVAVCAVSVVSSRRNPKVSHELENGKTANTQRIGASKKEKAAFPAKREGDTPVKQDKKGKSSISAEHGESSLAAWAEWIASPFFAALAVLIAFLGIVPIIPYTFNILAGLTIASILYHKFKTSTHMGRMERLMVNSADAMVAAVMAIFCVSTLAGLPDALSHEKWIRQVVVTLSCFVFRIFHMKYRKQYYTEAQKTSKLPREAILFILFSAAAAVSLSISAVLASSVLPDFAALSTTIKPEPAERLESYVEKVKNEYLASLFFIMISYVPILEAITVLYTQALIFKKLRCASEKLYRNIAFVSLAAVIAFCAIWVLCNAVDSGYYSVSFSSVEKAASTSYSTTHANNTV